MTRIELIEHIHTKGSFLCVGLDPVKEKIPQHLMAHDDWILQFNMAIIDATAPYCVAFKPNTAFYEAYGSWGWEQLEQSVAYIKEHHPHHFIIADAKRGDIGNTSSMYARAFFEQMDVDAITVAPYMGEDSIRPFLEFDEKWVIVLALTSNKGSQDFQYHGTEALYKEVIRKVGHWGTPEKLMFVAGATRAEQLQELRTVAKDHFLLVPGVGAQGGSLSEVYQQAGLSKEVGLLVNSSRGIIYAGTGEDFAEQASHEALELNKAMTRLLKA
jgi:orotidine-5'-phosphate decarboxylase